MSQVLRMCQTCIDGIQYKLYKLLVGTCEETKKAVMDNMDTQPMSESVLSPISKLQLHSPGTGEALQVDAAESLQEESAEEEEQTQDECIEPIECHEVETFLIESDEDCMLSPKKIMNAPAANHDVSKSAPPAPSGTMAIGTGEDGFINESQAPFVPGLEVAHAESKVETICDSDEEKKGVFKDSLGRGS